MVKKLFKFLFGENKETKEKEFPSIKKQLSTQDPEGMRWFFTPDGQFHKIKPSKTKH